MRTTILTLTGLFCLLMARSVLADSPATELASGIRVQVYDIDQPMEQLLSLAPDQTPNWEQVLPRLDLREPAQVGGLTSQFRTTASATLSVDIPGEYAFRVTSDDGVVLFVDEQPVVIHDGPHPPSPRTGFIHLDAGTHGLRIEHFQGEGGFQLTLEWKPPEEEQFVLLDGRHLAVDPTITPVMSPGKKRLQADAALFRPGDTTPVAGVHPAFALCTIRPDGFQPKVGAMAMLPDRRLAVTSFEPLNNGIMETEPNGTLWTLDGVEDIGPDELPTNVILKKAAEGLWDPLGLLVTDGRLFVAETEQITELIDEDGDGYFETHKRVAGGWTSDNYHHFTFGLEADPDDPLTVYTALSVAMYIGQTMPDGSRLGPLDGGPVIAYSGPNPPNRGTVAKIDLRTGEIDYIAGGFRTPNGLVFGPGRQLFITENQGGWMPASKINQVRPGHFYGYKADVRPWTNYPEGGSPILFEDRPFTPPAVWISQNEVGNSPTQPVIIPDDPKDGPYAGQMLVGELTMGGIRRVVLEEVGGRYQGAIFRFSQGLEAGVNRLVWGPGGALYVGMTGYRGNWTWRGTTFGLQKLVPTGVAPYEILSLSAQPDGFVLTFTKPADVEALADPKTYQLRTWTYESTPEYGGPNIDEHTLQVNEAIPSPDGKSVRLVIPGLKEGYVLYLRTDPPSQTGEKLWSTEAWYTLNRIPEASGTSGGLRYRLSDGSENWPPEIRSRIVKAMDEAVALYNEHGRFDKELRVSYSPDTPTADANFNGHIRFGGQIGSRTALHEICHTLGIGTTREYRRLLEDGRWTGEHAVAQLREFDGPDAVLKGDRQHFWPYGLNYDREDGSEQRVRHVKMVIALRKDMGLGEEPGTRP